MYRSSVNGQDGYIVKLEIGVNKGIAFGKEGGRIAKKAHRS